MKTRTVRWWRYTRRILFGAIGVACAVLVAFGYTEQQERMRSAEAHEYLKERDHRAARDSLAQYLDEWWVRIRAHHDLLSPEILLLYAVALEGMGEEAEARSVFHQSMNAQRDYLPNRVFGMETHSLFKNEAFARIGDTFVAERGSGAYSAALRSYLAALENSEGDIETKRAAELLLYMKEQQEQQEEQGDGDGEAGDPDPVESPWDPEEGGKQGGSGSPMRY